MSPKRRFESWHRNNEKDARNSMIPWPLFSTFRIRGERSFDFNSFRGLGVRLMKEVYRYSFVIGSSTFRNAFAGCGNRLSSKFAWSISKCHFFAVKILSLQCIVTLALCQRKTINLNVFLSQLTK